MPFRQPTPMTIRTYHFRGNAYEFPVESILDSQPGNSQLLIRPSTGYLVTAQDDTTPRSAISLNYVRQVDGSWAARTTITLLANGPALISGSIILQDPLGDSVTLLVSVETFLIVSDSFIQLNETEPDHSAISFLKIRQQGARTPVVLSTDVPDHFTLAVNRKELNFLSNLTITPTFDGTYIYVRYAPNRPGRHVARLLVKTPYDSKIVELVGNASGRLRWYTLRQSGIVWLKRGERIITAVMVHVIRGVRFTSSKRAITTKHIQPTIKIAQMLRLMAIVLLAGLLYGGYIYRCLIIPGSCQSQNTAESTSATPKANSGTHTHVSNDSIYKKQLVNNIKGRVEIAEHLKIGKLSNKGTARFMENIVDRQPTKLNNKVSVSIHRQSKHRKKTLPQMKSKEDQVESDLEKELNGKSNW